MPTAVTVTFLAWDYYSDILSNISILTTVVGQTRKGQVLMNTIFIIPRFLVLQLQGTGQMSPGSVPSLTLVVRLCIAYPVIIDGSTLD